MILCVYVCVRTRIHVFARNCVREPCVLVKLSSRLSRGVRCLPGREESCVVATKNQGKKRRRKSQTLNEVVWQTRCGNPTLPSIRNYLPPTAYGVIIFFYSELIIYYVINKFSIITVN